KNELRHKLGLIYDIYSYVSKFKGAAVFNISTSTTKPEKVIEAVSNVMNNFEKTLEGTNLQAYKDQFRNMLIRQLNDPFFDTELLWTFFKFFGRFVPPSEIYEKIESIRMDDVAYMKNTYLKKDNLYIMCFGENEVNFHI